MRNAIVLTGLKTSRKKKDCITEVKNFLSQELGCSVEVDDVFYLSGESTDPMVITLESIQEKNKFFQNVGKLKYVTNEEGKPFFIRAYLPPRMNQQRRRENDIHRQNQSLKEADRKEMKRQGGRLIIAGNPTAVPYQ